MKLFILIAIVAVVLVGLALLSAAIKAGGEKYKAKSLLTDNEKEFFLRLKRALVGYEIFPQVCMGAILDPNVSRNDRRYMQIRGTFSQKIMDYVICDGNSLQVLAVVELDDRTHNAERDRKRDSMLQGAGYHVIRWDSRNKPTTQEIQSEVNTAIAKLLAAGNK